MLIKIFLMSAALPAALVTLVCFLVSSLPVNWRERAQAVAIALGVFLGYYFILQTPRFPPQGGVSSAPWAAALLALYVFLQPRSVGARYLVRAVFVAALLGCFLWSIYDSIQSSPVGFRNLAAFFFLMLGVWSIVERSAESVGKISLIALPMIAGTACSLLFVFQGSASLGQIATTLSVILGGLVALALFFPKRLSSTAVVPFLSALLVGYMAVGHFYVEIHPMRLVMMCFPFFVLWVRKFFFFIPKRPLIEAILLGAISSAPVAYWLYEIYKTSGPLY